MSLQEVTTDNFETEVYDSTIPVVVDFYAQWCAPCKMLAPILQQIQSDNESAIKIVKVDIEQNEELARQFNVRNVPTLVFLEQDAEVGRKTGAVPKTALIENINKAFGIKLV